MLSKNLLHLLIIQLSLDIWIKSRSKKSSFRRTSTVPEEKSSANVADILGGPVLPISHSLNGTPDSLLSGPLNEGQRSAPDTGDSIAPTTPFPPISQSSSPFTTPEPDGTNDKLGEEIRRSRRTRRNTENGQEDRTAQRAFGSPVSLDGDDLRFWVH